MQALKWLGRGIELLCLALLTGCRVPAQIVWSPDGAAAAYRVEDRAYLIDSTGKVGNSLGTAVGGFAWSADSKNLYFANMLESVDGPTAPVDSHWQSPAKPAEIDNPDAEPAGTTQPTSRPVKERTFVALHAFTNNKSESLATFESGPAMHMALSPDQQWLAVVCAVKVDADTYAVYAYHLPSKKLYLLSDFAGFAFTFTGPNRLAYVEPDRAGEKAESMTGKVVEVTLNPASAALERKPLLDVIPAQTPYLAALGDNLLLTAVERTFPGRPTDDNKLVCKLFQWTRANCGIVALADDVGPLFAISPDGQRVMIEKLVPKTDQAPAKRELQLIRANGSDGHTLRDLSQRSAFALWPAWHGNNEITFTSPESDAKPVKVKNEQHVQYDIVQYKLNDKLELDPIQTLSSTWDDTMKPYIAIDQPMFTTEPTTKP